MLKKGKPLGCRACLPDLWPENEEAYEVYAEVSGQYIMGPGGAIAIRHDAICEAMERLGTLERSAVFQRVNAVFRLVKEATKKDKVNG